MDEYNWSLPMDIAIPLLAVVACLLTAAFAFCLCCASGCCPTVDCCRQGRRRNNLLRRCTKVRYSHTKKRCTNETCPICLDDFRDKEKMLVCPCRHGFHRDCILHCMERSPHCPVCKAVVRSDVAPNQNSNERTPLV